MKKIAFLLLILFATYNAYSQSSSEFSGAEYYLFLNASTNEEYESLVESFSETIEDKPSNVRILKLRGETYLKLNDYVNALADFKKALEINSTEELQFLIGRTEARIKGDGESYTKYQNLIRSRELIRGVRFDEINFMAGVIDEKTEPIDLMLKTNEAINLDPNYAEAFFERGKLKMRLEDYRGALSDFEKAKELNFSDESVYLNIAYAFHYLGRKDDAIRNYDEALMHNPDSGYAYLNRGIAKLGKVGVAFSNEEKEIKDQGCMDLSEAGELGSSIAYDLIKECCNSNDYCNYFPITDYVD